MKNHIFILVLILGGFSIPQHSALIAKDAEPELFKSIPANRTFKTPMLSMINPFNQKTLKFLLNVSKIEPSNLGRWTIEQYYEKKKVNDRIEVTESRPSSKYPNSREYIFKIQVTSFSSTKNKIPFCIVIPPDPKINNRVVADVHWFGTFFTGNPQWPSQFSPFQGISGIPLIMGELDLAKLLLTETLFLNSDGFAILLDELHPWSLEYDQISLSKPPIAKICLNLVKSTTPYLSKELDSDLGHPEQYYSIMFRILMAPNLKAAYQSAIQRKYIRRPTRSPPKRAFSIEPIWLTDAFSLSISSDYDSLVLKKNMTAIKDLQNDDSFQHFKPSQILVCQELVEKLPELEEISSFLTSVHSSGNRILLHNVSPFVPTMAATKELVANDSERLLLKGYNGLKKKIFDFSKPSTIEWIVKHIAALRSRSGLIDGIIQTDGLVSSFLVKSSKGTEFSVNDELIRKYPNFIVTKFSESFWRHSESQNENFLQITNPGYKTQELPTLVRLPVKGEYSVNSFPILDFIAGVLTLSLSGYQFVISELENFLLVPENENAFVLWIDATCFLPGWTIFPRLDWAPRPTNPTPKEAKAAMKACAHVRTERFIPIIGELVQRWIQNGEPIIRPMWYADQDDAELTKIKNQFMLGDDLIAAPVITSTATGNERNVYLPAGQWIREYLEDGKFLKSSTEVFKGKGSHFFKNVTGLLYFIRKK